ncbi:hypothetical protein KA017_00100 [Candidatus Woesebacteria bacterium]|nr:hypothetical protein [Candidatus Woesebacteria bacterium]
MQTTLLAKYQTNQEPIVVTMVGLGFMGFGFFSANIHNPGLSIPLVITRRPSEAQSFFESKGITAEITDSVEKIKKNADAGIISISDNLDLIVDFPSDVVFEVTGTVDYGTDVALRTLLAKKQLVTMNPELQATVGTQLKNLYDAANLKITDVLGDQPGSISRLIASAKLKGFEPVMAGNMKRYMDHHATQAQMQPWAEDKGLAVRQTVSFTDGTKQSIEMTLVANYFGMSTLADGMHGPEVANFDEVLHKFNWEDVPQQGVVDYIIGRNLFPGVFIVAKHTDPEQQKYLRYLNMGNGPYYVLFDSYHLCHLEVAETIGKLVHFDQPTINNGNNPTAMTITIAKSDLPAGTVLDGIGGDYTYGSIRSLQKSNNGYLPVGVSHGAVLLHDVVKDQPILLSDVTVPNNHATRLLGLV